MSEIVPVTENEELTENDTTTSESENDKNEQSFDDYLLDVIETNTDVNANLDKTNNELTGVTEQLETLLQVFEAEEKEDKEKQAKDSLTRENDLKFREKLLKEISNDDGQTSPNTELLQEVNSKLDHLVKNSYTSEGADTVLMIYGFIVIPFFLICAIIWKMLKPFI